VKWALYKKELLKGKRHLSQDRFFFRGARGGGEALCIHCSELDSIECLSFDALI